MSNNNPENKLARIAELTRGFLDSRYILLWAMLVGVVLVLPSLKAGLVADDYHHKILMTGGDERARILDSPLDMFRFFGGDVDRLAESVDYGLTPWWTYVSEELRAAFWRPLASASHWLDYVLWPNSPPLMHLHSILWFALLVLLTGLMYRRFLGIGWVAGLAVLLFAIDDAHGMPAGFLCNRNALMATVFGILAILVHDRWRKEKWRIGLVLGPVLLTASLLCAEFGISTLAYIAAYALFVDQGKWQRRVMSLAPYVAVVIVWRLLWTHLGYGVSGIGGYIDPVREPLRYMSEAVNRIVFLLLGQWAAPPSDLAMIMTPNISSKVWWAGFGFIVALLLLLIRLLRRDKTARFWFAGMVFSLVPICATWPQDRLLLFTGIGAMGLVAQFVALAVGYYKCRPKNIIWRVGSILMLVVFLFCHVILSPGHLVLRSRYPMGMPRFWDCLELKGPLDNDIVDKTLVLVNPPSVFVVLTSALAWAGNKQPMPTRIRALTSSLLKPVQVERPDDKTLVVRPEYGYLAWVLDQLFRNEKHPFALGDRVELSGMTVEIRSLTGDGRPRDVAFIFDKVLEDSSFVWLKHKDGIFVPFIPPAIGESVELAGESLF
jgi:hypothetical protein